MLVLFLLSIYFIQLKAAILTYSPISTNFANPDRGYVKSTIVYTAGCVTPNDNGVCSSIDSGYTCATEASVQHCWLKLDLSQEAIWPVDGAGTETWRSNEPYRSVIWRTIYLNSGVAKLDNIPTVIRNWLSDDFVKLSNAGFKAYYRFAYGTNGPKVWKAGDATNLYIEPNLIETIKNHATQLLTPLIANKGLVLGLNMGFLGFYGENHWYDENLGPITPRPSSWQPTLITHLLSTLSTADIPISVRRPTLKSDYDTTWNPLDNTVPFTDNRRRIGLHNDCFLSSPTDQGTFGSSSTTYSEGSYNNYADCSSYWSTGRFSTISCDRTYWKNEALYTHSMGETCANGRTSNSVFKGELESYRFSLLNLNYLNTALALVDATTHNEVRKKIGYRLEITQTEYTESAGIGTLKVSIKNTGYAKLIKNKNITAIVGTNFNNIVTFSADTTSIVSNDLRTLGSTVTTYTIPINLNSIVNFNSPILVAVTDINPNLNNKKWNVRFASSITWENSLGAHVTGFYAKIDSTKSNGPIPQNPCYTTSPCITVDSTIIPKSTPFKVTLTPKVVDVNPSSWAYIGLSPINGWTSSWLIPPEYPYYSTTYQTTWTTPSVAGTYYIVYIANGVSYTKSLTVT